MGVASKMRQVLEQFLQDLRYTGRTMRRDRAFTALVALSLALGIGANSTIYSFMDAILRRSLPVADPGSLVVLNWRSKVPDRNSRDPGFQFVTHTVNGRLYVDPAAGRIGGIFPFPAFELFQKSSSEVFSRVFAHYAGRVRLGEP